MGKKTFRTIPEVYDLITGEVINSDTFFTQPLDVVIEVRYQLEKVIQKIHEKEKWMVCHECWTIVKISGSQIEKGNRNNKRFHFQHVGKNVDCSFQNGKSLDKDIILARQYQGVKESELHIKLKNFIFQCLLKNEKSNLGVQLPFIEKYVFSMYMEEYKRKRPDVGCSYKDLYLVFELQLSHTFLSVIAARQHFYESERKFILWIFRRFDSDDEIRRLMDNDIFYTNHQNAFVLDAEAEARSAKENDLVLKCYYKQYFLSGNTIDSIIRFSWVKLSDLIFNKETYKVYYREVLSERKKLQQHLIELNKKKEEEELAKQSFRQNLRRETDKLDGLKNQILKQHREKEEAIKLLKSRQLDLEYKAETLGKLLTSLDDNMKSIFDYVSVYSNTLPLNLYCLTGELYTYKEQNITLYSKLLNSKQTLESEIVKKNQQITRIQNQPVKRMGSIEYRIISNSLEFITKYWRYVRYIKREDYGKENHENFLMEFIHKWEVPGKINIKGLIFLYDFALMISSIKNDIIDLEKQQMELNTEYSKLYLQTQEDVASIIKLKSEGFNNELQSVNGKIEQEILEKEKYSNEIQKIFQQQNIIKDQQWRDELQ